MKPFLVISLTLLGAGVLVAAFFLFRGSDAGAGPVTCTTDEQCGGDIVTDRFCRDGNLWGNGQHNTCLEAGTPQSRCETSYAPFLIEACENGCSSNGCA